MQRPVTVSGVATPAKPRQVDACRLCGAALTGHSHADWCSTACKQRAYRARKQGYAPAEESPELMAEGAAWAARMGPLLTRPLAGLEISATGARPVDPSKFDPEAILDRLYAVAHDPNPVEFFEPDAGFVPGRPEWIRPRPPSPRRFDADGNRR